VYVNIEDKNEIVKLSATDLKVLDTWPLTGCESPSGMAIDRANHRLFSVCDGGKMAVTDYTTGKVIALATIGQGPDAAFYDPQFGFRIFPIRAITPETYGGSEGTFQKFDEKSYDLAFGVRGTIAEKFDWDVTVSHADVQRAG
jgi:hypothetical protein